MGINIAEKIEPKKPTVLFSQLFIILLVMLSANPVFSNDGVDRSEIYRLLSENRYDEAEVALNKRIDTNDKDASAIALLGEVYRQKGDRKKASKFLNKAILLNSKDPAAYLYRGKLYYTMQEFDKAESEFTQFIDITRPLLTDDLNKQFYLQGLHSISSIYAEMKRYEEERRVLDEILSISPEDQAVLYNYGVYYYMHERNRSKAYQFFSKTIEIDPNSYVAKKAKYAIEFIRVNPDSRVAPDFSFIDQEYRD